MAAPLHDHRTVRLTDPVATFFALEAAPAVPADERPLLRVIPGGREAALRRRLAPSVYRRRRSVAAGIAATVFVVTVAFLFGVMGSFGPTASEGVGAGGATAPVEPGPVGGAAGVTSPTAAATSYVVQPGDSLWSIAQSLDPEGDIRTLVDELSRRAGPGVLEAGTRLDLTGLEG